MPDGATGDGSSDAEASSSSDDATTRSVDPDPSGPAADTTSGDGPGHDDPQACPLPDGSPPSFDRDGHTLVPIDVLELDARLEFDATGASASAHARMRFRLGPEAGLPLFDLRQTITAASLDDVPLGAGVVEVRPTSDPSQRMQVVNAELARCSEHVLELDHAVGPTDLSDLPLYDPAGVVWFSQFIDLLAGGYAEMWIPANLPHDAVTMRLEIAVTGTDAPHVLAANGAVEDLGPGRWRIAFPEHYTSLSPLVVLAPASLVERASEDVVLPDGHAVTLDVIRLVSYPEQMADLLATTADALAAATLELGEYPHGDRYLVFASELQAGMEYEGATASMLYAIPHEVFHSWVARGIRPLRHRDGWIDEAWTTFAIDDAYAVDPIDPAAPPSVLSPADPWLRVTPIAAYQVGPPLLSRLGADSSPEALRGALREFYVAHAGEFVTTDQLQDALAAALGSEIVDGPFARFVHGQP